MRLKQGIHEAWGAFIGRVPWEWLATLTFDSAKSGLSSVSRELADRETHWWCGHVARVYRSRIAYVYAIERHQSGSHHGHVLFVGLPATLGRDGVLTIRGRKVPDPRWEGSSLAWRERNGHIVIQRVNGSGSRVALYTSKSLADDTGELVLSDTLTRQCFGPHLRADIGVDLYVPDGVRDRQAADHG